MQNMQAKPFFFVAFLLDYIIICTSVIQAFSQENEIKRMKIRRVTK